MWSAYHVSFLMQWESGRTRRTLLQVVRESKAKGRPHQAFFREPVPEYFFTQQTCPILLPMSPHSGQSSQLVFDTHDRNAQFLATLGGSARQSARHSESGASGTSFRIRTFIAKRHLGSRCWTSGPNRLKTKVEALLEIQEP